MNIRPAWRADFSPRDRRPIYDWARDHISLQPPFSRTGPFEVLDSRHFLAPFDALLDPAVREVNICAPVRDGKTLIADIWLAWTIVEDPGPFLGLFQKDDVAQQHCETRTWRILESIPLIKAQLDALDRHNARTQEIIFDDPIYIWGPSTKNLQSKPVRYLWFDEVWQFKKGIIREAKGRLGDALKLGIDKTLVTSQGGQKVTLEADRTDDWWNQFDAGELNVWNVPCRDCGKYHVPCFSDRTRKFGLVWEECRDERGLWKIARTLETLRYVCPHCAAVFTPSEQERVKAAWNRNGKHVRQGEEKRVKKSFTNNGLINFPWEFLAEEFLTARNAAAQGDRTATIQFFQKYLAEFYDPQRDDDFERLAAIELVTDALARPVIEWKDPETGRVIEFKHRQMMVDVQINHFWVCVSIWSDHGDDLTLHFTKADTWVEIEQLQKQFDVPDQDVGVDINYHDRETEVATECCRHGHLGETLNKRGDKEWVWFQWCAYRGTDKAHFTYRPKKGKDIQLPYIAELPIDPCNGLRANDPRRGELVTRLPDGTITPRRCQVWKWSNPTIKDLVVNRRDGRARGIVSALAPGDWNEEFSRQMHGEKKMLRPNSRGFAELKYHKTRDNHAFDCKGMDVTHAMRRRRLLPPAIEEGEKKGESTADER